MFKEWLSVRNAAQKFGYCNQESLRRRLRQLRKRGFIVDVGEPPSKYVKERNTYGIMCGMVKEEAAKKYPWLVKAYKNDEYVDGSEREEDIKNRAKRRLN